LFANFVYSVPVLNDLQLSVCWTLGLTGDEPRTVGYIAKIFSTTSYRHFIILKFHFQCG